MNISSRFAWLSALFLATALFYAPLAYGCTRPEMLPTLYVLLAGCIVSGAVGFLLSGRLPAIPRGVLICAAIVLAQGWWVTYHPRLPSILAENDWLVGSTMETLLRLASDSMLMTTMLLLTFLVACALFNDPGIRRFILVTIAVSCALIAVIGLAMKFSDPLMHVFWKPLEIDWNNFAFYRYHGNAGAFLVVGWPIILVFARRALSAARGRVSISRRVFWITASLACIGALCFNASKASLAIGLLIAPWPFSSGLKRLKQKTLFIAAAVAVLVLAAALFTSSQFAREAAFQRMTNREEVTASFYGRVTAYHQFLNAVPEVGAFGMGPGLFQVAFPYQTSPLGMRDQGLREYAHEDFLQTALEWGWFGTIFWTLLVAGGLYRGLQTYLQRELFPSKTDRHLVLGALLGVMGVLAQSVLDFPLQIASIRLPFLVLLAFCWISPRLLVEEEEEERAMPHYWIPVPPQFASKKQLGRKPVRTL